MVLKKIAFSNTAPTIKDAVWAKPVEDGFTLSMLINSEWKPLKIAGEESGNYEAAGAANAVKKALVGSSKDSAKSLTLYGLKKYIDEQIASID